LALVCLVSGSGCSQAAPDLDLSGFNLLVITIDTLRADRLGSYGDERAETPHLDSLARRGVRFENSYTHVPLTLPAHGSLFTGRYPFEHGVRTNGNYALGAAEQTLAERLQEAGYYTTAVVGSYILSAKFGLSQGFDEYDDALDGGELLRGFSSEVPAEVVRDKFRRQLTSLREPYFAWVHFYDPHQPYRPPPLYGERFADDPYRGEIAYVDSQIGALLADLEARDLLERTLVVVTSDHGEGLGQHVEVGHGYLAYEDVLRVPLILTAGDRLRRAEPIRERVRHVDLMPTLLDLLGVEPTSSDSGESLVPLLAQSSNAARAAQRPVYFESMLGRDENNWAPLTGLMVDGHKFIALPETELYDLDRDPEEKQNLAAALPERAALLEEALQTLLLGTAPVKTPRLERSAEDLAHLRALGYVSSQPAATDRAIDPKRGVRLLRELQKVRERLDGGDLDGARQALDRVADANREIGVGSFYALRHELAVGRGNDEAATTALEAGIARFPDSEELQFLLANYHLSRGRYQAAEVDARRALALAADFSQAIIVLARATEEQGRGLEAIDLYRRASELEPRNHEVRILLARALIRAGDAAAAWEIYERLLAAGELDEEPDELFRMAMLGASLGRSERAEALFRRGLELRPEGIHHLSFGLVLGRQGKFEEGAEQLRIALDRYRPELTVKQASMAERVLAEWSGKKP
jgi:arylsulfatase A-like enzyme/Tfp pilus assembly protein PilF